MERGRKSHFVSLDFQMSGLGNSKRGNFKGKSFKKMFRNEG